VALKVDHHFVKCAHAENNSQLVALVTCFSNCFPFQLHAVRNCYRNT